MAFAIGVFSPPFFGNIQSFNNRGPRIRRFDGTSL